MGAIALYLSPLDNPVLLTTPSYIVVIYWIERDRYLGPGWITRPKGYNEMCYLHLFVCPMFTAVCFNYCPHNISPPLAKSALFIFWNSSLTSFPSYSSSPSF